MALYQAVRPALFALEPERAHQYTIRALAAAGKLGSRTPQGKAVELMGLRFPNRVGLAAGFDKNAEAVDGLGRLGFGFLEIGTVTPRPQKGQPMPRVFRLPMARALINRMGFPNDGASAIARRLHRSVFRGVIGANIGKNADTPLEHAVDDYLICLRALHSVVDYVALNISSPNTAALRDLHLPYRLEPLLAKIVALRHGLKGRHGSYLPILLKVSPDLAPEALTQVACIAREVGVDGLIATNTTLSRQPSGEPGATQAGGLSGAPLHALAVAAIRQIRSAVGPEYPVIGVGGVDSPERALALREAGADLVQLYTGLVYRGPRLVKDCVRVLSR